MAEANPITYLDGSEPPFLIQNGDQDCTVAIESPKRLVDALNAACVEVKYDLLSGAGHCETVESPVFENEENVAQIAAILDVYPG